MQCKSYSHFFSKKFQHICVSLGVNFNESLTNDIVSFEQLGPDFRDKEWNEQIGHNKNKITGAKYHVQKENFVLIPFFIERIHLQLLKAL